MKKATKKVVKKVIEKEKTLEELNREIKWLRTEWRNDYSSCRTLVRRDRRNTPGRLYKVLKISDKGFCILIYGREKKDYENISLGKEWAI
ncbi:hypothetical protein LCGC14_0399250 [marine sediment metagenome]|uniref:Uncharacterized protein n=1 Tax=marine sediment metagenome TaxID=412755 RepID=A0A0F9T329_9ZZZZ